MALRDHNEIAIRDFKGRWKRGQAESCPPDHFTDELNLQFTKNGVKQRDGTTQSAYVLPAASSGGVLRAFVWKKISGDRVIFLDGVGKFWDSGNLGFGPILTDATISDFSMYAMNDRLYISPHDRTTGKSGKNLYVYDGTNAARLAGGTAPGVSGAFAAAAGAAGNPDKGNWIFSYVFVTNTGFITKATNNFILYNSAGGTKIVLTNIGTGGATVVQRRVIATRVFQTAYTGRYRDYAYYFVPDGTINDNVTTTITLNDFSNDLTDSADYLLDLYETIPAFLGLTEYNGSLVGWGENANPSTVRVSQPGNPEAFSTVDGFINVEPSDNGGSVVGGSVHACMPLRGNLYIHKLNRTYYVRDDGSGVPANWNPTIVDKGIGTEVFGVSKILDAQGANSEGYLVASPSGLYFFNGAFQPVPLTYKIADDWSLLINSTTSYQFNQTQVLIDQINRRIYVSCYYVPTTGFVQTTLNGITYTVQNVILYADYNEGLDPENIKWSLWVVPYNAKAIFLKTDAIFGIPYGVPRLCYCTDQITHTAPTIFEFFDLSPQNKSIDIIDTAGVFSNATYQCYMQFPPFEGDTDGAISHWNAVRLRATSSDTNGAWTGTITDQDGVNSVSLVLSQPVSGKEMQSLVNFKGVKAILKLTIGSIVNANGTSFSLNIVRLFAKALWKSYAG